MRRIPSKWLMSQNHYEPYVSKSQGKFTFRDKIWLNFRRFAFNCIYEFSIQFSGRIAFFIVSVVDSYRWQYWNGLKLRLTKYSIGHFRLFYELRVSMREWTFICIASIDNNFWNKLNFFRSLCSVLAHSVIVSITRTKFDGQQFHFQFKQEIKIKW